MSLDAVKNMQNSPKINNRAEIAPPPESSIEKQSEEKSNGKALLWGSLAALAIGGGIYLATRGRSGSRAVTGNSNSTDNLTDMTIDAFKKAGNKFKNGIAYKANGQIYLGKLTHQTKDGETLVLEYSKPCTYYCTATRYKDGNVLSAKKYQYFDGKIHLITDATLPDTAPYDKRMIASISDNGKEKNIYTKNNNISINRKNGTFTVSSRGLNNTKYYNNKKLEVELDHGKYTIYHKDGKTPRIIIGDNIEVYDETGKEILKCTRLDKAASRYYDILKETMKKYNKY